MPTMPSENDGAGDVDVWGGCDCDCDCACLAFLTLSRAFITLLIAGCGTDGGRLGLICVPIGCAAAIGRSRASPSSRFLNILGLLP